MTEWSFVVLNTLEMSGCQEDVKQLDVSATFNPTETSSGSQCWILVQQALLNDGSYDLFFYRNWRVYSQGFGDASGNFWIGNEQLHQMTQLLNNGLYFDMY